MSVTIKVKSESVPVSARRQTIASRVVTYLGTDLPPSNLLCFLDNDDLARIGTERGRYEPIHDDTPMSHLPEYISDCIFVGASVIPLPRVVDDLILVYGSTCVHEIGLAMTLAHELQHSIQHYSARKIWAANSLINQLERSLIQTLKLTWSDIPIEREARIVSKRVAVHLFGEQRVAEHIEEKIREHVNDGDAADWQFVRTLGSSSTVDLRASTCELFRRLKGHVRELEAALERNKKWNRADFGDIDLYEFLPL